MLSLQPLGLDSIMLAEVRAYLRLDADIDDVAVAGCVVAAVDHAEQFTRQILIQRAATEIVSASGSWQILSAAPVAAVLGVTGIPAEGVTFALDNGTWEAKFSSRGEAYFRVLQPGIAGRVELSLAAGLAPDWANLPESLRLGLLRLSAYFYANRDSADDEGPPAAALALLHPWRRMLVA